MFDTTLRLALVSVLIVHCFADLPSYIKPCNVNDLNVDDCIKKHANEAIPNLLKYGKRDLQMDTILPYSLDNIEFKPRKDFILLLKNLEIFGLENMKVANAGLDWNTKQIKINIKTPKIVWKADYQMEGTLFDMPIYGHGKANITYLGADSNFAAELKTSNVNGQNYFKLVRPSHTLDGSQSTYSFDNLYEGDEQKSKAMHKLLNDNWRVLFDEMAKGTHDICIDFYLMGFNAVFKNTPAEDIFITKASNLINKN